MRFSIATYNIHKGFSPLQLRVVIHELRENLHGLAATSCSCRMWQASTRSPGRYDNLVLHPHTSSSAGRVWQEVCLRPATAV